MTTTNDELYIDLLLSNTIQSTKNQRVPIQFMQSSTQPILPSTNNYKLSIIRFALNTESLPIFIPTMTSATETKNTIYSITMSYNNITYQQYMQFTPQNINPTDPDEYFFVYSYQYVIYLVNKCIQQCLAGLNSSIALPTTTPPTMVIDPVTLISSLSIDDTYFGYNETNKINIYMNFSMYGLFASMPAIIVNTDTLGMDYQLNNLISTNSTLLSQDYTTTPLWNPVGSIIFLSNLNLHISLRRLQSKYIPMAHCPTIVALIFKATF